MEWKKGTVVTCLCGREKDRKLCVVGLQDGYLLLCDGKERRLEKPKRKNPKHVETTNTLLQNRQMQTNKALRQALK